jgi:hypothetical protein
MDNPNRYLELVQEIGQFNVLRSFMHMNNIPDTIINYIFSLACKEDFHSLIDFFTFSPEIIPIDLINVAQKIKIYMGLDENKKNGERTFEKLVYLYTITLVDCEHRYCSIQKFQYNCPTDMSNYEYEGYIRQQFSYLMNRNKYDYFDGIFHCISCYPSISYPLQNYYTEIETSAENALFDYYVLGKKKALNNFQG